MRVSMGRQRATLALPKLAQGTVCNILNEQEIKPHKVRYYLERRDPEFKQKMAEVLCVYREVKLIKETAAAAKQKPSDAVAIISYDEKPGIRLEKVGIGNAPEVVREVGVHHVRMAAKQQLLHLDHRLLSIAPGAVGIEFRGKVGFEDRLQHHSGDRHDGPGPAARARQTCDLGARGPRGRPRETLGAMSCAPSPFRRIRAIDDDIGAGALVLRLASINPEPALAQASQGGAGGMGKPIHCVGQLLDRSAVLPSEQVHHRREF